MGIYDRDYSRYGNQREPGVHLRTPQSMVISIIIVTFVVFVLQFWGEPWFTDLFACHAGWYKQPWRVFELLTTGFLHDTGNLKHIIFNMLAFWFFGKGIEAHYGSREFTAFYLTSIVFASLVWCLATYMELGGEFAGLGPTVVGASGGVSAVLLLFAINYPHSTVSIYGIIPIPAWLAGILWVGQDLYGVIGMRQGSNVAFAAHLGGFLFAYLYYKFGWKLSRWMPSDWHLSKMPKFKRGPALKVHNPETEEDADDKNARRLDDLLAKVHAKGQDSLTGSEKRELQKLSTHYRNKRS